MASAVSPASWNNQKTIDFIHSIHCHPEIWDLAHPKYRDRNVKRDIWGKIASEYGITLEAAQGKFKSLRTYAKCEAKKIQSKRKKGTEGTPLESSWFAYTAMGFVISMDFHDNALETAGMSAVITQECDADTETKDNSSEREAMQDELTQEKKKVRDWKRHHGNLRLQEAYDYPRKAAFQDGNKYSSFGNHVATKLNSYQPRLASLVEYKISQILYEADMGFHDYALQVPPSRPLHQNKQPCPSFYTHSPAAVSHIPSPDAHSRAVLPHSPSPDPHTSCPAISHGASSNVLPPPPLCTHFSNMAAASRDVVDSPPIYNSVRSIGTQEEQG